MNPQQQRENFFRFIDALPQAVVDSLSQKNLDIIAVLHEVCVARGLVLYEIGNICEGVRCVLAGEDSASNFVAFIQKDERIEEDNRPKIPALAYEIQQKIFDPVLPILKQAGFKVKEGKVPAPLGNTEYRIPNIEKYQTQNPEIAKQTTPGLVESATPVGKWDSVS